MNGLESQCLCHQYVFFSYLPKRSAMLEQRYLQIRHYCCCECYFDCDKKISSDWNILFLNGDQILTKKKVTIDLLNDFNSKQYEHLGCGSALPNSHSLK